MEGSRKMQEQTGPRALFRISPWRVQCVSNDRGTKEWFWVARFRSETSQLSWPFQNQVTAAWLPNLVWCPVNSQAAESLSYSYVSTDTLPQQQPGWLHVWFSMPLLPHQHWQTVTRLEKCKGAFLFVCLSPSLSLPSTPACLCVCMGVCVCGLYISHWNWS